MSKIWLTADWHLADSAWLKRPEIYGDAANSLKKLSELVDVDDVILAAGDLYDKKLPTAKTVIESARLLNKVIYEMSIDLVFIQGQHERTEIPWLYTVEQAQHIDFLALGENQTRRFYETTLKNGRKVRVYALDWCFPSQLQERLDAIEQQRIKDKKQHGDAYEILMLHQTCNAVRAGCGNDRSTNLEFYNRRYKTCELYDGMIPSGFNLVVVGDTHYHTEFQLIDNKGHLQRCLSPGSLAQQAIDEIQSGQCFVLDLDKPDGEEIYEQELYRRPYQKIRIEHPVDFDQQIREWIKKPVIKDHFVKPLVRFDLYENDAERITQLTKACENKAFPFFFWDKKEQEQEYEDNLGQVSSLEELVTAAIAEADATDEAKELLTDLLSSPSPDEVLDEYYKATVKR